MVVGLEMTPMRFEPFEVEATMALLIDEGRQQPTPQGSGQRRPSQQCPGEELDRHQFMVSEARQAEFSMPGIGQLARTGQSVTSALHA